MRNVLFKGLSANFEARGARAHDASICSFRPGGGSRVTGSVSLDRSRWWRSLNGLRRSGVGGIMFEEWCTVRSIVFDGLFLFLCGTVSGDSSH